MSKSLYKDNRGLAAVAIVLIVVVVAAVAGAGYYVYKKQKETLRNSSGSAGQAAQKAAEAACESEDKNICKFYSSWKDTKYYTVTSSSKSGDGATTTTTYKYVIPDRFHLTTSGDPGYEIISIGDTTYTKDTSTGVWYKQTSKPDEANQYKTENTYEFDAPTSDDKAAKTTYKYIATEACGKLECYKYQVIDPSNESSKEYIWFDTKDFLLRKTVTESADGTFESTFSYDKVEINEPTPVQELQANQVYIPGQGAVTIPSQ